MSSPSLRELARGLGLSHTTVSEALRDSPRVNPKTRDRVKKAAEAAGYRLNPLAGALMSEMRRSRSGTFRGVLAILDLDGPTGRPPGAARYHAELAKGAETRAVELGFKAETIVTGQRNISDARLDTILRARGIRGVFLLPVCNNPDISGLNWSNYAGVYSDYIIERPALHSVCSDHYRSMMLALQQLQTLGYRRPGFALARSVDTRLLHRWEAAFRTFNEFRPSPSAGRGHAHPGFFPSLVQGPPTRRGPLPSRRGPGMDGRLRRQGAHDPRVLLPQRHHQFRSVRRAGPAAPPPRRPWNRAADRAASPQRIRRAGTSFHHNHCRHLGRWSHLASPGHSGVSGSRPAPALRLKPRPRRTQGSGYPLEQVDSFRRRRAVPVGRTVTR
jgi:transcriptional regulator with XRE-family HTH domain